VDTITAADEAKKGIAGSQGLPGLNVINSKRKQLVGTTPHT
jgi:hypothetical protein